MSTDDLIQRLSGDLAPVKADALVRRLTLAVAVGGVAALAGALILVGARPDLFEAVRTGPFWMKAAYTTGLALFSLVIVHQSARPGGGGGMAWAPVIAVVGLALAMGAVELWRADPASRGQIWMGHSWSVCMPRIVGLSIPVFVAVLLTLRSMAPTRLRLAGFAAGVAAGAVAATVYGLSCDEVAAAFMSTWYSLAILVVGVCGALLGPRLLRW